MRRRGRLLRASGAAVVATACIVFFGNDIARAFETDAPSVSVGRPGDGRLRHGKRLPTRGANFRAYSRLGALLGRNSVHGDVRSAVIEAYRELSYSAPEVTYVYGETGWPSGGPFPPHRTHRNGLSVDFMVPVRDARGRPATLPTAPWRKFGYAVEFDTTGRAGDLRIDYDAVALHLAALDRAARKHGLAIELVILAPEFRRRVQASPAGTSLARLPWMTGRPWVRHDEHYHVDFRLTRTPSS